MTENARQANDSEHDIGRNPDKTPRDQIAKTLAAGAGLAGDWHSPHRSWGQPLYPSLRSAFPWS